MGGSRVQPKSKFIQKQNIYDTQLLREGWWVGGSGPYSFRDKGWVGGQRFLEHLVKGGWAIYSVYSIYSIHSMSHVYDKVTIFVWNILLLVWKE